MESSGFFSDHLAVLIAALLVAALLGGPRRLYRALRLDWPGRSLANVLRLLEKRLNRDRRPPEERRGRGAFMTGILLALALMLGMVLESVLAALDFGVVIETLIVASLIAVRSSADRAQEIAGALGADDLSRARRALEGTAWRNASLLDAHGLARAGIELLAMHFAAKVAAPVFWYALLGLPGLFASRLLTLLHEVLAQNAGQQRTFGWAAHALQPLCFGAPHALACLLLLLAAGVSPTSRPRQAWNVFLRHAQGLRWHEMALWPIPVMAAATHVALGGPASVYAGGDWVGRGTLRPAPADLRKAWTIYALASFLLLIVLAALA